MSRVTSIINFLFDRSVWQGVWANFLFALLGAFLFFIVFSIYNKRKVHRIFGLNRRNRLTIIFSNTFVRNAIDRQGNQNLYTGPAIPENEFRTIKELFDLLSLIGKKDNTLVRFIKFLTFDAVEVEYELSPANEIQVAANRETNILAIGGPAYNNATSYFQNRTKLFFSDAGIVNRVGGVTVATPSMDYDYGILEKIKDEDRIVIVAAGFHINGTRGTVKYLVDHAKKLPKEFAYLIKFPHPSQDSEGYKKPLEVKNFYS